MAPGFMAPIILTARGVRIIGAIKDLGAIKPVFQDGK